MSARLRSHSRLGCASALSPRRFPHGLPSIANYSLGGTSIVSIAQTLKAALNDSKEMRFNTFRVVE